MRAKMLKVDAPPDAIDVVGTGGDASGSFNISTCAAFIVAGAGVPVAKHGNRALSSRSGAADVLGALGVKIELAPDEISALHPRGRHRLHVRAGAPSGDARTSAPTRVELGTRTIFNLLGPLSNPAGVKRQMIGVFSRQWIEPMAQVLKNLGSERVWVVHGSDGLDEITTVGPDPRRGAGERHGARPSRSPPRTSASTRAKPEALRGGDAETNADGADGACSRATRARSATSRCSMPRPRWSSPARAKDLKEGAALAAASRSTPARPKAGSTG